jgi:hypothetical protein
MKTKIKTLAAALSAVFFVSTAWASDVYIDQIGDDVQINITQRNGMNTVNADGNPAIVSGDGIRIDFLQDGDLNTANIFLRNDSDGTVLNYSAEGSFNSFDIDFSTAIDNTVTIAVDGDNNAVSVCGNLACTSSASVNDTVTVANITGNANTVRFALNANNSTNNLAITGSTNAVDVTQSSGASHVTNVGIVGGNNSITIIQGQ